MRSMSSINYSLSRAYKRQRKNVVKLAPKEVEVKKKKTKSCHHNKYAIALLLMTMFITTLVFILVGYKESLRSIRLLPSMMVLMISVLSLIFAMPRILRDEDEESYVDLSSFITRSFMLLLALVIAIVISVAMAYVLPSVYVKVVNLIINFISLILFYLSIFYMWSK